MATPVNESATILANNAVGPHLYLMTLHAPKVASLVEPGQFVSMRIPEREAHILRRPFSIYDRDSDTGTVTILYQEVGILTSFMTTMASGEVELLGPVGHGWSLRPRFEAGSVTRALLVGGGVGAAPLFLLARELVEGGFPFDVVLGAQTMESLVCRQDYHRLMGREPLCATDDGSYGTPGFCTVLVEELLGSGFPRDGSPYDAIAVCGPEPLMKAVCLQASQAQVPCEVSLERRMACGIGACLSCVVDTISGKRRSCVDGPIFDAAEVIW